MGEVVPVKSRNRSRRVDPEVMAAPSGAHSNRGPPACPPTTGPPRLPGALPRSSSLEHLEIPDDLEQAPFKQVLLASNSRPGITARAGKWRRPAVHRLNALGERVDLVETFAPSVVEVGERRWVRRLLTSRQTAPWSLR